jgi:hypothetical protein
MLVLGVFVLVTTTLLPADAVEAQLRTQVYASGFSSPVAFVQDQRIPKCSLSYNREVGYASSEIEPLQELTFST